MLLHYKGVNVHTINHATGSVRFLPGINEVSEEQVEAIHSHPAVRHLANEGLLEFHDAKGIKHLPEAKALRMIAATVDEDLLYRWRDTESKRSRVIAAIDAQLEKITWTPEENEDEDDKK